MARGDDLDEFAKMVWGKRSEGLPVPELDLSKEITPQEVANILLRSAFVQILNTEATSELDQIRFIRSQSGWLILDYGNAMTSSSGEDLFQHGIYMTQEEGTFERVCSGTGTTRMKIVNTAADMVRIAKEEEKWPSIHIVDGHPLMMWGIWKAAKDLQIPVTGYVPSKEDEAKYERIRKTCPETLLTQPGLTITKP